MQIAKKILLGLVVFFFIVMGVLLGRYQPSTPKAQPKTQLSNAARYSAENLHMSIAWSQKGIAPDTKDFTVDMDPEDIPFNERYYGNYGWICWKRPPPEEAKPFPPTDPKPYGVIYKYVIPNPGMAPTPIEKHPLHKV